MRCELNDNVVVDGQFDIGCLLHFIIITFINKYQTSSSSSLAQSISKYRISKMALRICLNQKILK